MIEDFLIEFTPFYVHTSALSKLTRHSVCIIYRKRTLVSNFFSNYFQTVFKKMKYNKMK